MVIQAIIVVVGIIVLSFFLLATWCYNHDIPLSNFPSYIKEERKTNKNYAISSSILSFLEKKEKKSFFKQISFLKKNLREKRNRECLVQYLAEYNISVRFHPLFSFNIYDIPSCIFPSLDFPRNGENLCNKFGEFWGLSSNRSLFNEKEKEWIKEIEEKVEEVIKEVEKKIEEKEEKKEKKKENEK